MDVRPINPFLALDIRVLTTMAMIMIFVIT